MNFFKKNNWFIIDGENKIVGRLASYICNILIGKNNINYKPYNCSNNYVILINTDKLIFTANKVNKKVYYHHTGYVGGLKSIKAKELFIKDSRKIMWLAVKGMLPKNKIGIKMLKNLKLYKDIYHTHVSQKPTMLIV